MSHKKHKEGSGRGRRTAIQTGAALLLATALLLLEQHTGALDAYMMRCDGEDGGGTQATEQCR